MANRGKARSLSSGRASRGPVGAGPVMAVERLREMAKKAANRPRPSRRPPSL